MTQIFVNFAEYYENFKKIHDMLTLQQLRGDKEAAIAKLAKKGVDAAPIIAKIEELDDRRKALQALRFYL